MTDPREETQVHIAEANPFLGALLKSSSDRVICFNRELQLTAWNPAMVLATGLSRREVLFSPIPELFSAPLSGQLDSLLYEVLCENKALTLEHLVFIPNQAPAFFSASFYPLQNTEGEVTGGFAILKDSPSDSLDYQRMLISEQVNTLVAGITQQLICTLSRAGKLLDISANCLSLLAYSPAELIGKPAGSLMHPDDVLSLAHDSYQFPDSASNKPLYLRLRHKLGHYLWFESKSQTVRHPETELILEVVVVLAPISDRRLLQATGSEEAGPVPDSSISFLELALEASNTGVWYWNAATEACDWDSRMQQLFGLEPGTFDGRFDTFLNLIHPDDRATVQHAMRQAVISGMPYRVDYRVERPDKTICYISATGKLLYLPNGTPDQMVGLCVDITSRKLAEKKILEQEALLRSVLNSSLSAILSLEPVRNPQGQISDFTIRMINQAGAAMGKCQVDEAKGKSFLQLFPSARQEGMFDYFCSVTETGVPVSFEKLLSSNGHNVWFAVQASPMENGLTATLTDITAQKENELALIRNKYYLEKTNETAPFLMAVLDLNDRKAVYTSKKLLPFLGYAASQSRVSSADELLELLHPDDAARVAGCMQQVASAADYDVLRFLFRLRNRFNNYRWYQTFIKVFRRDAQGHVQEVVCLLQDVDQSEQNKHLLNAMLDSSLSGIMAFEAIRDEEGRLSDFRWVLMNKPAEQMIGRKARLVVGKGMMAEMPGNLSEGIFHRFVHVVETGEPVRFEHFYQDQGGLTWFEISAVKMGDGFTATFTDITDRKEADWQLLENQLFNQKITDTAPSIVAVYELETSRLLFANRQLTAKLGYSKSGEATHGSYRLLNLVHPDDVHRLRNHQQQLEAAHDGEVLEIELQIKEASGNWRWMVSRDTVFRRDEKGRVLEVLSVVSDIEELRQTVSQLNLILNASLSGICALKALRNNAGEIINFEWLLANQRTAQIIGVPGQKLIGRKLLDFYPADMSNRVFPAYVKTVQTGEAANIEVPFLIKGSWRYLQIVAVKLEDGLMVMTEDITEKKAAKEHQRKSDMLLLEAQKVACLGHWDLDLETKTMQWSEELCQLLGYETDQPGENYSQLLQLMGSETGDLFERSLQQAALLGEPFTFEHSIATKSGINKRFITRGQLLPEEGRQKLVGICMDVSDIYAMQQKLEKAGLLKSLSEAVPQIIWTIGKDGQAEFINTHWQTYTGLASDPLPVCPMAEVAHPQEREVFLKTFQHSLAVGEAMEIELRLKRADGQYRWHLIRIVPQKGQAGQPNQWFGTATETHELKTALEELQNLSAELKRSNEELQRANTDLDNFHYAASHDLKAPVINISGLVDALSDELSGKDATVTKLLELLQTSVSRFSSTVAEMTEVCMAERVQKEHLQEAAIAVLLEEILADMQPLLEKEHATVSYELEVPTVKFHRGNLRSILYNLISNAIKYRLPGREPVVKVRSSQLPDGRVMLSVADNSRGIAEENLSVVFELFRRVPSAIEGTGMGLYIVKKIVENSGGTIEVESKPGQGSTFKLYLRGHTETENAS